MDKKSFWIRFIIWVLLACILPVMFICFRYHLFTKITTVQIGGWGLLAIIIIAVFCFSLWKYIKVGLECKWTMTLQIISGIAKITLPLLGVYFITYAVKSNVELFMQALLVAIVCETAAIPVNPMPKWAYEQSKGKTTDAIDYYFSKMGNSQTTNKTENGGAK